jgi:hypothetical protein
MLIVTIIVTINFFYNYDWQMKEDSNALMYAKVIRIQRFIGRCSKIAN